MEPPSMLTKGTLPHECDASKLPAFGCQLEESTQAKIPSSKPPQDALWEMKMETTKSPGRKISELLKGKEKEWTAVARKAGPLQLLDLPLDLLTEILREASRQSRAFLVNVC